MAFVITAPLVQGYRTACTVLTSMVEQHDRSAPGHTTVQAWVLPFVRTCHKIHPQYPARAAGIYAHFLQGSAPKASSWAARYKGSPHCLQGSLLFACCCSRACHPLKVGMLAGVCCCRAAVPTHPHHLQPEVGVSSRQRPQTHLAQQRLGMPGVTEQGHPGELNGQPSPATAERLIGAGAQPPQRSAYRLRCWEGGRVQARNLSWQTCDHRLHCKHDA